MSIGIAESAETDLLLNEDLADYRIDDDLLQSKTFCDKLELFNNCLKKIVVDLLESFGITDIYAVDRFYNDTKTRLRTILKYLVVDRNENITVKDLMDRLDVLNQAVIRLKLKESQNVILNEVNEIKRKKALNESNNNNNNIVVINLIARQPKNEIGSKCAFLFYVSDNNTPEFLRIKECFKQKLQSLNVTSIELNDYADETKAFNENLNRPIFVLMESKMDFYFDYNVNKDDKNNRHTKFGQLMHAEYLAHKCSNKRFYRFNVDSTVRETKYPFLNSIYLNSKKEVSFCKLGVDQNDKLIANDVDKLLAKVNYKL